MRLKKKKKKPIPVTIISKSKIKIPLVGSLAKACTETKTPDLTKKVPNKLSKNVVIDKKIVQFCSDLFLLEMITVCKRADAVSHGSNEAFSTGSQNQKPPQPNS